jgi:hypothetical protein
MIYWALIDNMSRRLTEETTQTWHDTPAKTDTSSPV